jgi:hypothetical protein
MTHSIQVDEFEPREIEALLMQGADVTRNNLNRMGFADYLWFDWNHEPEQMERKQVTEILSDMPGVEMQLRRELDNVRRTILIIEGIVLPGVKGCHTFMLSSNGRVMRPGHVYNFPYARYEAWKWGMENAGVTVWHTGNWEGTANAIAMRSKQVQSEEHSTLGRHLKPLPLFKVNPQVMFLMGIADVGPEKAEALITSFGNAWDALRAPVDMIAELPGWGKSSARAMFKAIGRDVGD